VPICLPVYKDSDLYGWSLSADLVADPNTGIGPKYYWRLVTDCNEDYGPFNPEDWHAFNVYSSGETHVLTPTNVKSPGKPVFGVDDYECGQCFYIQALMRDVRGDVIDEQIQGCIGCFQKICDPCYTTVIQYYNNENAFGFIYVVGTPNVLTGFFNRVRLSLYFKQPQFPSTRNVFSLSNGNKKILSARIQKEWICQVDYFPKEWHERLVIAINHDFIAVSNTNANLTSEIEPSADYQIEWQDYLDYPMARASFKANQIPYNNVNSNCL